jgi:tetratricopeptide (TPR) repeat protein
MSKHWAKEEVHHSFLVSLVDKILNWVTHNRDHVLGGAVGLIVIVLLGFYFVSRQQMINEHAWDNLFEAQQLAAMGKLPEAIQQADAINKDYSRTGASGYAVLLKGDILFETGKYKEAADVYQKILDAGRPDKLVPFALSDIASCKQALADYSGSIDTANSFMLKYSNNALAQHVLLTLAISQELAGKATDSINTYKRIKNDYPRSYEAELAGFKLGDKK